MKAIIPAGGRGTRLRPFTYAIPKELMIVGDKPIIEHNILAMKDAGIYNISIVLSNNKHAIMNYLGSGDRLGVNLTYLIQDEPKGVASGIYEGRKLIRERDKEFVVTWGDSFIWPYAIKEVIEHYNSNEHDAFIGIRDNENPYRVGIVELKNSRIVNAVEKPGNKATSKFGMPGIYIFKVPLIFDMIKEQKPGYGEEYQITDTIQNLITGGYQVGYHIIKSNYIDVGTFDDWKRANEFMWRETFDNINNR